MEYVKEHGEGNWNSVQKKTRLSRCGKSCRLRWANHLRPDLKKGSFSLEEEHIILDLHAKYGNKWARMASQLPGRTDNEIKNYWNTRIKRRQRSNLPLYSLHKQAPKFQFSQHQNHQVHHSQSSPIQFASSYPMKHYHQSPLSLYNPVGISRTIPLRTPQFPQQFHGRYSPYQVPINRFTPASYNFNEPNPMHSNSIQTPFNPDGLAPPHCSNFSMKLELPSNQSQQTADYSGLLDALLQESDAMAASKNNSRIEEKCTLNFGFDFNDTDMDQLLESASQIDVTDFADCLTGKFFLIYSSSYSC
ncbi:hypothetical protein GIB67_026998 [Kingdonia uniflora]|uniref:Uncharacterized protein n=1 Tax=Kingdonia uniflora TaxID=39325 RepID=A0A7J7P1W0_9MAGN|nr:hypothetical protein GIB67_026998 [Kingdonia uniflora]